MEGYTNLTVTIDETKENEIRYNLETQQATIRAKSEKDVKTGIAILKGKGLLVTE